MSDLDVEVNNRIRYATTVPKACAYILLLRIRESTPYGCLAFPLNLYLRSRSLLYILILGFNGQTFFYEIFITEDL